MSRTAGEVPWLLQRADLRRELYHVVLNVDILVQLYSGCVLQRLFVCTCILGIDSVLLVLSLHDMIGS